MKKPADPAGSAGKSGLIIPYFPTRASFDQAVVHGYIVGLKLLHHFGVDQSGQIAQDFKYFIGSFFGDLILVSYFLSPRFFLSFCISACWLSDIFFHFSDNLPNAFVVRIYYDIFRIWREPEPVIIRFAMISAFVMPFFKRFL